jgi:hypothetical protein
MDHFVGIDLHSNNSYIAVIASWVAQCKQDKDFCNRRGVSY